MAAIAEAKPKQLSDTVRGLLYFLFALIFLVGIAQALWPVMLHVIAVMSGQLFAGFSLTAMGPGGFLGPNGLLSQDNGHA